ncbi:MAG: hypothetical protein HUU01_18260 [Saprospiraceae bacterium]|nr:hypothetical protein [Saprospiraceae bacterium]
MIPFDNLTAAPGQAVFSPRIRTIFLFFRGIFHGVDLKAKMAVSAFFFFGSMQAQTGEPTDIFFTDCGFILAGELASPSCIGAADGSALVYPFIGEGLTYEWIGLNNTTNSATNLAAGIYSLAVSDGVCTDTIAIPLQDPPAIVAPLLDTAICAFSAPIDLTDGVSGGTGDYTVVAVVSLLGAAVDCSPCAGNVFVFDETTVLEVTLQDGNGCTATRLVFVSLLDLLTATAITSPETCNNNGRIEVLASGGSGNYLYGLDNTNADFQQSNIFEGLAGGEAYTAIVLDLAGCSTSTNAMVALTPTFSPASIESSNASCYGSNNGAIAITGTNGNVIGYGLNSTAITSTQPVFNNLPPGNYTVFVIEPNNCINGYPAVVGQPDSLQVTTATEDVSCPGGADGLATINASGGNGGYRYALNNGSFNQANTFDHLQAGTYLARVQDVRFCENTRVFTIMAPDPPDLAPVVGPSCVGTPTGTIVIVEAGKLLIGDYQFSLDSINWQTENLFEGLEPGVYTVYIRYPDGCVFSVIAVVSQSSAPLVFLMAENPSCYELADGSISVETEGGQPPFSFALNDSEFQEEPVFTGLGADTYFVRITDANNCIFAFPVELQQPALLETTYQLEPMGDGRWYVNLIVTGGVTPYDYAWSTGSVAEDQFNLPTGNYEVLVTDAHGCESVLQVMAGSTGSGDFALTSGVRVFPVPSQGGVQVHFDIPVFREVFVRLLDARGTAVWQGSFASGNRFQVPLHDFPAGVYWLAMESEGKHRVFQLIKI